MKFEINENKLEKVIFKYLDSKNFIIRETPFDYYFLENEGDKFLQIRIRKSDMLCFLFYNLTQDIKSFFSIEYPMVEDVLTRYVEETLNIKVSDVWMDGSLHISMLKKG
jgi:hypothetical protein